MAQPSKNRYRHKINWCPFKNKREIVTKCSLEKSLTEKPTLSNK